MEGLRSHMFKLRPVWYTVSCHLRIRMLLLQHQGCLHAAMLHAMLDKQAQELFSHSQGNRIADRNR